MYIYICPGALNKGLFDQHLYLAFLDICTIQKCQHCQLCVLRENSVGCQFQKALFGVVDKLNSILRTENSIYETSL